MAVSKSKSGPKSKLRTMKFNNGVRHSPYDPNYFAWPHPALCALTMTLLIYLFIDVFLNLGVFLLVGTCACVWMRFLALQYSTKDQLFHINPQATLVSPNSIPDYLWPFAQISKYMAFNHFNIVIGITCLTVIVHSLEAAYTGKVCQDRRYSVSTSVKWVLATFIFGFPFLISLLTIKPRSKQI